MTCAAHWQAVYERQDETDLTWFEAEPALSLRLIRSHATPGDAIVDIGGGASRLVDRLLEGGLGPVTVLDISAAALAASQSRLGPRAAQATWVAADVTRWQPSQTYAIWHDRAVFHFLTDRAARGAYVRAMLAAVRPEGVAILVTFAEDGPERCSGLPVRRYASEALAAEIESLAPGAFTPIGAERHLHVTPTGGEQRFQVSLFRRMAG